MPETAANAKRRACYLKTAKKLGNIEQLLELIEVDLAAFPEDTAGREAGQVRHTVASLRNRLELDILK